MKSNCKRVLVYAKTDDIKAVIPFQSFVGLKRKIENLFQDDINSEIEDEDSDGSKPFLLTLNWLQENEGKEDIYNEHAIYTEIEGDGFRSFKLMNLK